MKRLRWQLLIVFIALIAIGLLLLSQQPSNQQLILVPEPVKGGIYTEALVGSLVRLNPTLDYNNQADRDVDRLLFSGLVKYNDQGVAQADLAESWGISKDGTSYNFAIKNNAYWHDGQPVTSDDVIFTVELLRHADYPVADDVKTMWKSIELKRLDEKTVQFRLPEPFSPFLDYLTFGILPKHLLANINPKDLVNAPYNLSPVGCGPYRFGKLLTATGKDGKQVITGIVLNANDKFYTHTPYIDQVVFRYYPDAISALAAYQQGEVLGIGNVSTDIISNVLVEKNLNLFTSRLPRLTMIFFNLNNPEVPFFKEVSIRQGLMQAINRQKIIDKLLGGQAIIANGTIFPGTWAYYDGVVPIPYDPDKAISYLKEAGYTIPASGTTRAKENQQLSFELLYPNSEKFTEIAQSIQADWSNIQVNVSLKPLEYSDLMQNYLNPRKYQAALVDLNMTESPDPDPYPFWHQAQITGGQNYSQWEDRQSSEYLEQARITVDPDERGRLYRNFQVRFASELPALPLYYSVYNYAVSTEVQGIRIGPIFNPSDRLANMADWFMMAKGKIAETMTPTKK